MKMRSVLAYVVLAIRFLRYISFLKLINFFALAFSYAYSVLSRLNVRIAAYPYAITFETVNGCNLQCPQCLVGMGCLLRQPGLAEIKMFENLIDEVKTYSLILQLHFQGEPFLHPQIMRFIEKAHQNRVMTIISTNGHFLTRENCEKLIRSGLDKIIVSVDGVTEQTYAIYRKNGNFKTVTDGIQTLNNVKNELHSCFPLIELQFLVFRHNEHELSLFRPFAYHLGANIATIKTAQFYQIDNDSILPPNKLQLSRYIPQQGKWVFKKRINNRCFMQWATTVITYDGWVVPCCQDKNGKYRFGNVNSNAFYQIWKSEKNTHFRKKILQGKKQIDICCNCPG